MRISFYFLLILCFLCSGCNSLIVKLVTKSDIEKDVYVLENEEGKKIVYIGMVHLGKGDYYGSVKHLADSLRNQGYLFLFEGVDIREAEDTTYRKFRKVAGFHFTSYDDFENKSNKYRKIAKNYNLQSKEDYGVQRGDINADYSLDSLIIVYENKIKKIQLTACDYNTPLMNKYKCKDSKKHNRYYLFNTLREENLLKYVKKYKDYNMVVIYGSGHRFMLIADIEKLGYTLTKGKLGVF